MIQADMSVKLCIDPGHGMGNVRLNQYDPGAQGNGHSEASVVLLWSETVKWYCHLAKIPFWATRNNDHDSDPVGTRAVRAEANGCTHFLSLHCNDADSPNATGTETYFRDPTDHAWALPVHQRAVTALYLKDRGLKGESDSQHTRLAVFNFGGPCCLVELGFISNPSDLAAMLDRDRRIAFAQALTAYLGTL